jgi:hypothetical protein
MKSFKQMQEIAKHKDGTYVAFEMRQDSKDLLDNFVKMNLGLDERISPDEYHTTVIYSRTPVPDAEQFKGPMTASANVVGYEVFPTKTGDKCLVMRLQSQSIEFLNKKLTELGATSDYDTYKPHVTICYNYTGNNDVSTLPVPQFNLSYDTLTVKPLDPEFIPGNTKD